MLVLKILLGILLEIEIEIKSMSRPTEIMIDLSALKHNLKQIKNLVPHSKVMAMVKANAYGHGIEQISAALKAADALGVACSEEGLLLREAGIKNNIVLVEGLFHPDELSRAEKNKFTFVVHQIEQIEMLEKYNGPHTFSVWLKINTGMNRLGFLPEECMQAFKRLMQCKAVKKPFGVMTHFAEADNKKDSATQNQIALFQEITTRFSSLTTEPFPKSLANSAGILAWPKTHTDWVRPGIMLYGASPFENKIGEDHDLKPVMSLKSALIAIHDIKKNARIGYGGTYTAPHDMRIGVVAVGYGDGYPRHAKNGTPVLIHKKRCPLVGRVSMDMITVDLSSVEEAKIGDPVILWGNGLPVETIAKHSDTIGYELLTRITQRVYKNCTA